MGCSSEAKSFSEKLNEIVDKIYPDIVEKYKDVESGIVILDQAGKARDEAVSASSSASSSATASELKAWRAEADRRTAESFANEPENSYVKRYISNGNGTYAVQTLPSFSALHYKQKAQQASALLAEGQEAFIPFVDSEGISRNIKVIQIEGNNYIPFVLANGTESNILVLGVN